MAKMSAANKKRIAEMKAKGRQARILQAKKTGERAIPDKVIRTLGSLGLPPIPWVYDACLDKLMRG